MVKRFKFEIIRDILGLIRDYNNKIKPTPLLRQSNLSSSRFKEYYNELLEKGFVKEVRGHNGEKVVSLTEKGNLYLEKYKTILCFVEEFGL